MTTIGDLLQNARLAKKLTLEQVEKATRIRLKFLEALERNQFDRLPPSTFTKGFVKNYATFLGLSPDDALAFYRRQVGEEKNRVLPERNDPVRGRFAFTPQFFTFASVALLVAAFFGYLIFSYFQFAGSPVLNLASPANNIVVSADRVDVRGKTDPQATLTINDQQVSVSEDGSFSVEIPLQPGLNTLNIVATNKFRRQTIVVRNLRLEK